MLKLVDSKNVKGSTRYPGDKIVFNICSEGPSSGISFKKLVKSWLKSFICNLITTSFILQQLGDG